MKNQRGVALILAIGTIAVLAVIATTFAFNMRLEYKIAVNYNNSVQARYVAEAALQKTIAELKEHIKSNAFTALGGSSFSVGGSHSASATITDTQGRININTCSLGVLQDLIDVLRNNAGIGSLTRGTAAAIFASRPNSGYLNLQDIIMRTQLDRSRVEPLMPFITTHSSGDAININTAAQPVIAAVLIDSAGLNGNTAWDVAGDLEGPGLTSWHGFNSTIDGLIQTASNTSGYITASQASDIKDGCNPNRNSGGTKFRFHPGGYYIITITGTTSGGGATAELTAMVKISDIYTETTESDFKTYGVCNLTTWHDTCPVDTHNDSNVPDEITGAIKLGFWDDFEDNSDTIKLWTDRTGQYLPLSNGTLSVSSRNAGSIRLPSQWSDFTLSVWARDLHTDDQMRDVAVVLFRNGMQTLHTRPAPLSWTTKTVQTAYGSYTDDAWAYLQSGSTYEIEFLTVNEYIDKVRAQTGYGITRQQALNQRHLYHNGQVRLFTSNADPDENNENGPQVTYAQDYNYHNGWKKIEITAKAYEIDVEVDDVAHLHRDLVPFSNNVNLIGDIALYGHDVGVEWDDIRVIPDGSGTYRSQRRYGGGDVIWGTMTGTVSYSTEDPSKQGNLDVSLRAEISDSPAAPSPQGPTSATSRVGSITGGNFVPVGLKARYFRYVATLTDNSGNMEETPVLEDVTITYLPKTRIESYLFH